VICIEVIWSVKQTKILVDALVLDEGMAEVPFNVRALELVGKDTEAAKGGLAIAIFSLQCIEIGLVQNHTFQIIPVLFDKNLDPTVQNVSRRQPIPHPGNGTLLQGFVNRKAVDAARYAHRP
jgi:hypothetical protein